MPLQSSLFYFTNYPKRKTPDILPGVLCIQVLVSQYCYIFLVSVTKSTTVSLALPKIIMVFSE